MASARRPMAMCVWRPTPGQWDAAPEMIERKVLPAEGAIEIRLAYKSEGFDYTIRVERAGEGVRLRVRLDQPLPAGLVGRAGFNLEFLPSAYFSKTYLADASGGVFPRLSGQAHAPAAERSREQSSAPRLRPGGGWCSLPRTPSGASPSSSAGT